MKNNNIKKLDERKMKEISAGGLGVAGIIALIAAGISFLGGLFDGYTRPLKCR